MDRAIPTYNRIVIERIQQKNMQTHYQKLFSIHNGKRPKANTSSSTFSKSTSKKERIQEEKSTEIDKSNVILFQKMNRIMNRPDPLNSGTNYFKITSKRFAQHVQRVNLENQQFLERLCKMKPTIDNKKMMEQRRKQLAILRSLGKNSYLSREKHCDSVILSQKMKQTSREENWLRESRNKHLDKSSSLVKFSSSYMLPLNARPRYTEGDAHDSHLKESDEYFNKELTKIEERRNKVQSCMSEYGDSQMVPSKRQQRSERTPINEQSIFLNKSILLFTTFKRVDELVYKVEINRRHKLYEIACTELNALDQRIVLNLEQGEGNKLLSSIDYDYQSIVDSLLIHANHLSINHQNLLACRSLPSETNLDPAPVKMRIKKMENKHLSHITEQPNESSIYIEDLHSKIEDTQQPYPPKQDPNF